MLQLPNDSGGRGTPTQSGSKAVLHVNLCQLSVSNRRWSRRRRRVATATATYANAAQRCHLPLAARHLTPLPLLLPLLLLLCCCTVSLITAIRAKECSKGGGSSPSSSLMGCTIVLIAQMTRRSRQQARQAEQAAGSHSLAWMTMKCMYEYSNQMRQHEHTHSQACQTVCSTVRPSGNLSPHGLVQFLHCQHMCRPPTASHFIPFLTLLKSALSGTGQSFKVSRLASTRFDPLHSFRFIHSLKSNLHNLT